MKIFNEVVEKRKRLVGCKCDRCKITYSIDEDVLEIQEFFHINYIAGYGSVFGDMNSVRADICQHCLKEVLGDVLIIGEG